jgi:hypothetical protein
MLLRRYRKKVEAPKVETKVETKAEAPIPKKNATSSKKK